MSDIDLGEHRGTRGLYKPEIDGLRAVAVTIVILFHLGIPDLAGGYVGVDVFFVISGFLITRLIVTEIEVTGKINFGEFYYRRLRRLFPALFATVTVCFIISFVLLTSESFRDFGRTVIASLIGGANFVFWLDNDYFDSAAITKPLLHTWSLGVEEQFYLIWPAFLLLGWRFAGRLGQLAILGSVFLVSLWVAEYWLQRDAAAAFYLLPARASELAIGAVLVWLRPLKSKRLIDIGFVIGIVGIVASALFYTDDMRFPGLAALLPCGAAALAILCIESGLAKRLLGSPLFVWTGRISYSLYLVHWPIIVFFYAIVYRLPSAFESIGLLALAWGLAWLQFYYVEQRYRYVDVDARSPKRFVTGVGLSIAAVGAVGVLVALQSGWPWRVPAERVIASAKEWRNSESKPYCENWHPDLDRDLFSCQNYRGKSGDIYIWGDSHAHHLAPGFEAAFPEHNIYILYQSACDPQSGFANYRRIFAEDMRTSDCIARNHRALESFLNMPSTNILLSSAKRDEPDVIAAASLEILEPLRMAGHQAKLLGDVMRPGISLRDCVAVPEFLFSDEFLQKRCIPNKKIAMEEYEYNQNLAQFLDGMISPNDIQCPEKECMFFKEGNLLFRDHHHLNINGSIHFIESLKRNNLLSFLE